MDDPAGEVARGARAVIVCPDIRGHKHVEDAAARLAEAHGLALAIGLVVVDGFIVPVRAARAATLFGEGQMKRIAAARSSGDARLVIVDGALSAIQQRNLEERLGCKVIDRTGLILEIFGERAATAEGRLQVELAHLDYQQSRLVRSWTHLERQRGGFGFLGGPGETQIEADRRMIRTRMARLRRELDQVRKTRTLHRARRGRAPWPVIALVGYTNAGKSTLFNRLTGARVAAQDMLFATLDPTMRAIALPGVEKAILSDTVGFIADLPTQLVAAFRATLEEVRAADLIVHVRDMANPSCMAHKRQVLHILGELGVAGDGAGCVPIIEAWNKWDLLDERRRAELEALAADGRNAVPVSAVTGFGLDRLMRRLGKALSGDARTYELLVPSHDGRKIAWLRAHGEVLHEEQAGAKDREPQIRLTVRLNPREFGRYASL